MSIALLILLALALVLVSAFGCIALFVRFLTSDDDTDGRMRFNPLGERPQSPWFMDFFLRWRRRDKQLTYRRDRSGRFRRHDR